MHQAAFTLHARRRLRHCGAAADRLSGALRPLLSALHASRQSPRLLHALAERSDPGA